MKDTLDLRPMKFRIKGPYGIILTPFDELGYIRFDAMETQIEKLFEYTGLSGVVVCGTTSEFIQMSVKENISVINHCAQYNREGFAVIAGACASNLGNASALAKAAYEAGLPAVLVCPPYYTPLTQEDVADFYRALADAVEIDIILYNIPTFTNSISFSTIEKLIEIENFIGVKDSSGNVKEIIGFVSLAQRKRPDFAVFTGTDQIILPALASGCVGSMTALSGILPHLNINIYDAFYRGDLSSALESQMKTIELLRLAESIVFPAGYKIIAEKTGYSTGEARQVIPKRETVMYTEVDKQIENEMKKRGLI